MRWCPRTIGLVALGVAALAAVTPFCSDFIRLLIIKSLILAILAMGLDLILGFIGLPSLGQAAYFGIGGYTVGILAVRHEIGLGWDFWLVLLLGVVFALLGAAVFGLLAIRATGVYFLMITLALGMGVWGLAYRWNSLTGGDNGIAGIPRPVMWLSLRNDLAFFYLTLAIFAASLAILALISVSPFGRSLVGIRESETRMKMLGYNVWLHKYLAFVLSGGFGGVAGVLWGYHNNFVSPEDLVIETSLEALLMVALGGPATLIGPAFGAGVIVFLKYWLSTKYAGWPYILGIIYVVTILYLPEGLMGIRGRLRWSRRRAGTPGGAEAQA
ncbi:MAG: branched-chain amino acid ABC transporter permease [Candidatus Methylomirabilales bacterium]